MNNTRPDQAIGDILAVDDNLYNLRVLSTLLTEEGYNTRGAPDGPTALMIAQAKPPDLILLDIVMPGMDGYEVCQQLKDKDKTRDIPVIFISALDEMVDKLKGFEVGGVDYIIKPFRVEEVLARVKAHLSLRRLQRQLEAQNIELTHEITERRRAEEELKQYRDHLEEVVEARTAELHRANAELAREITERVQVQEALQKSEEHLRQILLSISDHIYVTELTEDGDYVNLYLSPHVEALTGYPLKKFMADWHFWPSVVIHPDDREAAANQAARLAMGQDSELEYRIRQADGSVIWVRDSARVQQQEAGSGGRRASGERRAFVIIYGVVSDITGRKWAEEAVQEAHDQLSATLDALPDLLFEVDRHGRIYDFRAPGPELLYVPPHEFIGQTVSEVLPQEAANIIMEAINQAVEAGQHSGATYWLEVPTGVRWFELSIAAMGDPKAPEGHLIALVRDVTERVQAGEEIMRLQHLLRNITDSMPSALIALDTNAQILLWNPAAEAITGQAEVEVRGQSLWQVCPELARYRDLFEQVLCEGRVVHQHKEPLVTDGETVYHDVSVFPLKADGVDSTDSPRVEGAVLRIDDVTRRVQLEEMMLQSVKMASIGGLAAGVAHEINNPLGAMMQSAQMLQMAFDMERPRTRERLQTYGVDPEALGHYLHKRGLLDYLEGIRSTGARAAKIVSDLLSFSRKTPSDVTPNDLNTLVEQTLDLAATDYDLKKKYDFRDIEIVRELAPDLPQVLCDGQQIQQVVLNLVRNAAQAMAGKIERGDRDREHRPRLILRTAYKEEIRDPQPALPVPSRVEGSRVEGSAIRNRMVRLEVEDNGPGIPKEMRARLFEPFFTTKALGEGTGLGLWLCWSIVVERHGGRIWAEPVERRGTRFVVELPIA